MLKNRTPRRSYKSVTHVHAGRNSEGKLMAAFLRKQARRTDYLLRQRLAG